MIKRYLRFDFGLDNETLLNFQVVARRKLYIFVKSQKLYMNFLVKVRKVMMD